MDGLVGFGSSCFDSTGIPGVDSRTCSPKPVLHVLFDQIREWPPFPYYSSFLCYSPRIKVSGIPPLEVEQLLHIFFLHA